MRVVKPNQVAVLSRPYEYNNKYALCISGLILFPFAEPRYPSPETALWTLVSKELGATPIDESMPKRRGEILLRAHAHAPGGVPGPVLRVAIDFDGKPLKEVAVVGDRVWKDGVPSDPEPFVTKSIGWESAFGGPAFKRNPWGKGHRAKNGSPLPNIEHPRRLITSARQLRDPVGLGPYDLTWPQRRRKAGRYDRAWLQRQYPGLALDIDWSFFNVAPPDQWIQGFFRGDEELVLHNLHPTESRLRCKLPEVQLRCFVRRKPRSGEEIQTEVEMTADTLWLFPHASTGILVYHGSAPVREDDASDVRLLAMACEDLGQPKAVQHYEDVLARRLSKERGAVAALDDAALMPALRGGMKRPPTPYDEMAELVATEQLAYKNSMQRGRREVDAARDLLRQHGLDPDVHGPSHVEAIDTSGSTEEVLARAEAIRKDLEARRRKAEEELAKTESELRPICEKAGIPFDELRKEWRGPQPGGPPEPKAEKYLARLRKLAADGRTMGFDVSEIETYLADPDLVGQLHEQDRLQRVAYRADAHDREEPQPLGDEASRALRAQLEAAHRRGDSLSGRDLTGAQLAGIDLSGANLEEALLERCNLAQANLSGANLRRAVLVRANLKGARLDGADLEQANLSRAECAGASLSHCRLKDALLMHLKLVSVSLDGANLERATLRDTTLAGCSLRGVQAPGIMLDGLSLEGTPFSRAILNDAVFMNCTLDQVDFTEAQLAGATFYGGRITRGVFARIQGGGLRAVEGASFEQCDFRAATLQGACFRGSNLAGCDFSEARAAMADFSECQMQNTRLYHLGARRALFIRTDLTGANLVGADLFEALLSRAVLKGTDLSGANLYEADMALIQGDKGTQLKDTMMVRARIRPFHSDKIQDLD